MAGMSLKQKQRVLRFFCGVVIREQLRGAIDFKPSLAGIWCVAVVDRGGEDPAVGAYVEHVVGVISAGGSRQNKMNTGERFGLPVLELLLAQGRERRRCWIPRQS